MKQNTERQRLEPVDRIEQILDYAITIAKEVGYKNVTRVMVAERVRCSESLISAHFDNMHNFRAEILRTAIRREVPEIVLQGIVIGDPVALAAPDDLKERAKAILSAE